jgi:trimethylamine--corrinoid protein Co-methyltransferase
MIVKHEAAREMLLAAGCTQGADERVLMPRHLVEQARLSAPSVVNVYDRGGELALELGGYNSYFGTGSDLMWTYDLETGEHRPSVLDDVRRAARLCDALPNIDFVMSSAHPTERNAHQSYLLSFQAMMENSTKPLVVTAENGSDLGVMAAMAAALRGGAEGLRRKPYFVVYNEPTSPLVHPGDSVDKLLLCADTGVPSIYSPAPLAGATAPVTVAGHTVQGLAESLFGLVLHQLRRPGSPFIIGVGSAILDLTTMQSSYNDLGYLEGYMCAVEMAKWLDLPNWGNAGTTDSQLLDAQAGMEATQITFLAMQAGSNLAHDVGYLDFGLTGCLQSIVMVDEFIAMNRRLLAGVEVDRETLAVEAIAQVGPGGNFMTSKHTRRHMREARWQPTILNRLGRDAWLAAGAPDLERRARDKAHELLATHEVPEVPRQVAERTEQLVAEFCAAVV